MRAARGLEGVVLLFDVAADRLEHDVKPAGGTERRKQPGRVEAVGTEIMQDGPPLVEQRLDVDELKWPDAVLENPVARREPIGAEGLDEASALEVLGSGCAEHS